MDKAAFQNQYMQPLNAQQRAAVTADRGAVLLLAVARAGGLLYVIQTVTGFVLLGVFTDLFAPFVTPLGGDELMLSALWGALACGLGYGLVLRCGSNTGGSDTIGQIISRKTSLPVGATTREMAAMPARI